MNSSTLPAAAGTRRGLLRATALTLLCGLALLLGSGTASAHTRLVSSDPADGASIDAAGSISLTFNEDMDAGFSTITVIGPDGTDHRTGDLTGDGGTLSGGVSLGAAGAYQIGYRVISADGHPVTGSLGFTLTTDGPAAAAPVTAAPTSAESAAAPESVPAPVANTTEPDGGTPIWPWIVGAVVLVGGGVAVALRLGR